ncbi:putative transmembrane protein [Caballeronia hypogeia]|uniref:Transmembrane protein n=1 Tax=Caballeronia hypogeia TaxID=1777140 RepID=A0A157ZMC0_9BURK|nr:putative transmembrane protein [Caballeronia hypogeia]
MHSYSQATLLLLGIVVILVTPGPTNTLLAAAGLRRGVKRAMPLVGAELGGYFIAISAWGYLARTPRTSSPGCRRSCASRAACISRISR